MFLCLVIALARLFPRWTRCDGFRPEVAWGISEMHPANPCGGHPPTNIWRRPPGVLVKKYHRDSLFLTGYYPTPSKDILFIFGYFGGKGYLLHPPINIFCALVVGLVSGPGLREGLTLCSYDPVRSRIWESCPWRLSLQVPPHQEDPQICLSYSRAIFRTDIRLLYIGTPDFGSMCSSSPETLTVAHMVSSVVDAFDFQKDSSSHCTGPAEKESWLRSGVATFFLST